jgi:hypothetical protein
MAATTLTVNASPEARNTMSIAEKALDKKKGRD